MVMLQSKLLLAESVLECENGGTDGMDTSRIKIPINILGLNRPENWSSLPIF